MKKSNQAIDIQSEIHSLEDLQQQLIATDQMLLFHKFNGEIVAGSKVLAAILGYSLEELQQIYIANIKPKSLRISDVCRINKEDDAPVIFEKRNGQRFPANTQTSAFQVLIDGEVTNLCRLEISIFSDLQRYNRKELQLNIKEIENHLALLSGEIKRPIDNVCNLLSRLISYCDSEELKADLMVMGEQLSQIGQTSNEMVDTFKLTTNTSGLNPRPFNILNVIHQSLLETSSKLTKASVSTVIDSSVPELLFGDPDRFQQLLNRLAMFLCEGDDQQNEIIFNFRLLQDQQSGEPGQSRSKNNFLISAHIHPSEPFKNTIESLKDSIKYDKTDINLCVHSSKIKILSHLLGINFITQESESEYEINLLMQLPEVHDFQLSYDKDFLKDKLISVISLTPSNSALIQQLEHWGADVLHIDTVEKLLAAPVTDLAVVVASSEFSKSFYSQIIVELAIKYSIVITNGLDNRSYETASHSLPASYNTGNLGNLLATMMDQAIPFPYILSDDKRHSTEQTTKFKALIVGEVLNNNRIIANTLKQLNYSADFAYNGIDSVMACSKQKYDLILITMDMERMDGAETIVHIRKTCPINSNIKVIALAERFTDNRMIELKQADIQSFITYPLDSAKLISCVEALPRFQPNPQSASNNESSHSNTADLESIEICLDQSILSELLKDTGQEIYLELLSMYANEVRELFNDVTKLVAEDELRACKQVVHAAVSAAVNYGSIKLEKELRQFKQLINDYLLDDPNTLSSVFFAEPLNQLNLVVNQTIQQIEFYKDNYQDLL